MPSNKQPKDRLIQQVNAPSYCRCALNTLKSHVKKGNLPAPQELNGGFFWLQSDLDNLKVMHLAAYKGKRSAPLEGRELPPAGAIARSESLPGQVAAAAGFSKADTLQDIQQQLKGDIQRLAVSNRLIEALFTMLDSPNENVRIRAAQIILDKLLPSQKSTTVLSADDDKASDRKERTTKALEIIASRMAPQQKLAIPLSSQEFRVLDE